jgi:four helix bundle protein
MKQKTEEILERTFRFGVNTLRFLLTVKTNRIINVIIYQLSRASTSIGANYEEAQAAESKDDFIHKIGIVSKEARECVYWFRMLNELIEDKKQRSDLTKLLEETKELSKNFTSIKLTAQQRK